MPRRVGHPAGGTIPRTETAERRNHPLVNAMTIDVEDYYHSQALAAVAPPDAWPSLPSRVERNTDRLLGIFARHQVAATFFVLGWVADRHPALIRRIVESGHELASHGSRHVRADAQTPAEFRGDVRASKQALEQAGGVAIRGYRAATFSIGAANSWAHQILAEEGFAYSSSIYPIKHDLYGSPEAPRRPFVAAGRLIEVPMTTVRLFGRNLPASGGGFFRLLPYHASRWALHRVNRTERMAAVFYLHPSEIDPDQPRHRRLAPRARFRHYVNLGRTEDRLRRLLGDFRWGRMDDIFLAHGGEAATMPQP